MIKDLDNDKSDIATKEIVFNKLLLIVVNHCKNP